MAKYDVRKQGKQWMFMKEGETAALKSFDTKNEAVKYSREYLKEHGGLLRIWKSDGTSLQEERSYEIEARSFYAGVMDGIDDAAAAAKQFLPTVGNYVSKGIYEAGYYSAFGVVFGATAIARIIPWPNPLAHGVQDGAQAALGSTEEAHHPDKTAAAAS
jgi:hypothetical protein